MMFISGDDYHHPDAGREEEFNMRSCPEVANHSRYLAWDMQVGYA